MTSHMPDRFMPLVELTRGPLVESIHFGALAIVDAAGNMLAHMGDPTLVANLRSSAKPFQSLPLIEQDGDQFFHLTSREIAITCASHSGTDDHVAVLKSMHAKIGVTEGNLQCGIHGSGHEPTAQAMLLRGEKPTPYRHNCSGKHTGMLAQAVLNHQPVETYLSGDYVVQQTILRTFAEMVDLRVEDVLIGIDGCSAPTFAAPLYNGALGFARLADPSCLSPKRSAAVQRIAQAMMSHPDMVAGPGGFDTLLMEVGQGKIICKGGAEGYQGIGVLPGALGPGSPGFGIAYKIIDGDQGGRARPVIGTAILHQLGVLDDAQFALLKHFVARPIYNSRQIEVGEIRPTFDINKLMTKV